LLGIRKRILGEKLGRDTALDRVGLHEVMHIETLVIIAVSAQVIPAAGKKDQDDMGCIG
jgi:hypothetical protein